jgi:hypothetical protein
MIVPRTSIQSQFAARPLEATASAPHRQAAWPPGTLQPDSAQSSPHAIPPNASAKAKGPRPRWQLRQRGMGLQTLATELCKELTTYRREK